MLLAVSPAAGAVCPTTVYDGPLQLDLFAGDQAVAMSPCPRSEISLGVAAGADLDTPHYYGTLGGTAVLRGSYAVSANTEIFATMDAVSVRFTQDASLSQIDTTFGQTSVGALRRIWSSVHWDLAPLVRVVLPTSTGYENAHPFAVDAMLLARYQPVPKLVLSGEVGFTSSFFASAGPTAPAYGATLLLSGAYSPVQWLAIVVETSTVLGYERTLYRYVLGGGFRFSIRRHAGIELAAEAPVAGQDATRFTAGIKFDWRF